MEKSFEIGSIVMMKKQHPCGENRWEILRTGADFKLRCLGCGHIVMLDYNKFIKNFKKVLPDESR